MSDREAFALPLELAAFAGRIADIDTHELIPAQEFIRCFGPDIQPLVDFFETKGDGEAQNLQSMNIPGFPGDILPITADIVNVKGARAPGAVSPERRVEVMDAMGISRQLLFPTALGLAAVALYKSANDLGFMSEITGDRRQIAKQWFGLYNAWLRKVIKASPRIRPAALLVGDTPEELIHAAKAHIDAGFKAVMYLPAAELPGGRSPAHPDLDPLWAALADANCAFTLHIEGDGKSSKGDGWHEAPAFEGFRTQGEFNADPANLAEVHLPYERFVSLMVLGGVFDRHPNLRVGVIEVGAYWVGPMMQRLDLWHRMNMGSTSANQEEPARKRTYRLPEPPSHYVKQNIRVTPFFFEDVAAYIKAYDVGKVLGFSTDYPHVEGGPNAFAIFYDNLKPLGNKVLEDFFVNNGQLLLPPTKADQSVEVP
jgi:predicted TIM-barrel fold metal-dependent hydrolase